MDNSCYRSMYEGLREEYDKLYNSFKEAEILNKALTEENKDMEKELHEKTSMLKGITDIKEGLREKVLSLTDEIDDRDHLLEAYRAVIRDVMNQ